MENFDKPNKDIFTFNSKELIEKLNIRIQHCESNEGWKSDKSMAAMHSAIEKLKKQNEVSIPNFTGTIFSEDDNDTEVVFDKLECYQIAKAVMGEAYCEILTAMLFRYTCKED